MARQAGTGSTGGRLEVIATPIGNLGDLSPRARDVLAGADLICAEDTRHTRQMLNALGMDRPLLALHEHNESARVAQVLAQLQSGKTLALVSDAGTPLISDPGYRLVRELRAAGVTVSPIPGPCAAIAALSVAGVPTERFCFEGFLPSKPRERETRLESLARESRTLVLFEAPHRIADTLADCARVFGEERRAAVARELTKVFETVYRGSLGELSARAAAEEDFRRGEITVVIAGAEALPVADAAQRELLERVLQQALEYLPASKAAALAAAVSGGSREEAYALAVRRAAARRGDG